MGIMEDLQDFRSDVKDLVNEILWKDYTYTLQTVLSADPPTTTNITIYMKPTPLVKVLEMVGGRLAEVLSAAANLSAEALPVFLVSRKAFVVSGTQYTPQIGDTFVEVGGSQKFYVNSVVGDSGVEAGYFLTVTTEFQHYAGG